MIKAFRSRHFRMLGATALVLFAIACGGGEREAETATASDSVTTNTSPDTIDPMATSPASPGGTALVPSTAAGATMLVAIEDNSIGLNASSLPPGPAVFTIKNAGTQRHDFRIEGGEGIAVQLTSPLDPGQTGTLSADLKAGTYTASCPILDHIDRGETVTFQIQAQ